MTRCLVKLGCVPVLATVFLSFSKPQEGGTVLNPGDIAVVGVNSDGLGLLTVLVLVSMDPGTEIKLTDHSWSGNTFTSASEIDGILTWTAQDGVAAGTLVSFSTLSLAPATYAVSTGSVSSAGWNTTSQGSWGGNFGDSLIIYQGKEDGPNFVYAFTNRSDLLDRDPTTGFYTTSSPNKTLVPSGLTAGLHTAGISGPQHLDNLCYNGPRTGDQAAILWQIADVGNWTGNGGLGDTSISFTSECGFDPIVGTPVHRLFLPLVHKN